MKNPIALLCAIIITTVLASAPVRADALSEMAAFSVFDKVDLAELAKADVKTAHGPPMSSPRYLSVQSCYVTPRPPAKEFEALRQWNPGKHSELKIYLHADLPASPSAGDFARLTNAPNNGPIRALASATAKGSSELQLSNGEAKKLSGAKANGAGGGVFSASAAAFWSDLLATRAKAFSRDGVSGQPPYENAGSAVPPGGELSGLLREQEKIRRQFSGLLGKTGITRGAGSLKPELYWELIQAEDQGVLTLGAYYSQPATAGGYQAADSLYYASGGLYVGLTLYQMWPVEVDGRPSTLVWRGDLVSSAALASLHGVERLASESAMMKDIKKAVTVYRRDTSNR